MKTIALLTIEIIALFYKLTTSSHIKLLAFDLVAKSCRAVKYNTRIKSLLRFVYISHFVARICTHNVSFTPDIYSYYKNKNSQKS